MLCSVGGRRWFLPLWCWVVWTWSVAQGKSHTGIIRLGGPRAQNKWHYLSKFGYTVGTGSYAVRLKFVHPPGGQNERISLPLDVFLDEDWDEIEKIDICNRSARARSSRTLSLEPSGEWGAWENGTLHQSVRAHVWYLSVSACKDELPHVAVRVRFEAKFLQHDASEFSAELQGMLTFHMIYLLIFTGCLVKYVSFCRTFIRSADSLHPVIWCLSTAIIMQYSGELLRTLYLWGYSRDGSGLKAFDVLSEIAMMLSQVVITSLLIIIGLGYTLLQSKIGDLDLMIPLVFMISVVHIMLVGFGKIKDDASYKFHEHEGIIGWILLFMRLCLYAWFMWAVRSTSSESGMAIQMFLKKFLLIGSVYFLGFPVLFLVVKYFALYVQHKVMTCGLLLIQTSTTLWLARLMLGRGDYFKVSTLSSSFLPGGVKVGMTKEE